MFQNMAIGNLIILIGAAQGIFLSVVLWNLKEGKKISHRLLAAFLFIFALQMVYFVVWDSKLILKVPHLSMVMAPFDFALGPLFYFYARTLSQQHFKFERKDRMQFGLVIVGYTYFANFYSESAAEKIQYNLQSYDHMPEFWSRFSFASTIQTSVYMLLTLLVLARPTRTVKKYYSSIEKIDLGWIKTIMFFIVFAFFSCGLISIIGYKWSNYYSNIAFSFSIYAMGYYGMKQKSIFTDLREEVTLDEPEPAVIRPEPEEVISNKYEKSGLDKDRALEFMTRLDEQVVKEKLYTNPELTLQQLADTLNISLHHLSQILNQYKQQNFFDYINQLRVEEFKRAVLDPSRQHLSLLGIAFDCGFNSKAAFNTAFKKYTGTTPSAYRSQLKVETT